MTSQLEISLFTFKLPFYPAATPELSWRSWSSLQCLAASSASGILLLWLSGNQLFIFEEKGSSGKFYLTQLFLHPEDHMWDSSFVCVQLALTRGLKKGTACIWNIWRHRNSQVLWSDLGVLLSQGSWEKKLWSKVFLLLKIVYIVYKQMNPPKTHTCTSLFLPWCTAAVLPGFPCALSDLDGLVHRSSFCS